jgi:hypothetical protein
MIEIYGIAVTMRVRVQYLHVTPARDGEVAGYDTNSREEHFLQSLCQSPHDIWKQVTEDHVCPL